jgi:hypothetical protein
MAQKTQKTQKNELIEPKNINSSNQTHTDNPTKTTATDSLHAQLCKQSKGLPNV